jgi:hypothetical protein
MSMMTRPEARRRRWNTGRPALACAGLLLALWFPLPASAELVYLTNGRTISIQSHRLEGASLVLTLRGGGEIICEWSVVSRIEPDEVPYPDDRAGQGSRPGSTPDGANDEAGSFADVALQPDPRFDSMIVAASARHGVEATLVRAVIQVESNYQHRARSRKGARGLMQIMPSTARRYGVSNLYDPASNIEVGTRHLRLLLDRFPLRLALAAYNAGESAVERFGGIPPFAETRSYVDRILKLVGKA